MSSVNNSTNLNRQLPYVSPLTIPEFLCSDRQVNTQASQRRLVDDLERRLNPLFDALNCETLSAPVVVQLGELTKGL